MRKLKVFFRAVGKSILNIGYYKDILKARFSFSLKYLYFLLFLISLVNGLVFATGVSFIIPQIPEFTKKLESALVSLYPKELVLTFTDGVLKTNVKEPYFVNFPKEFPELSNKQFEHFIVIDTKAEADAIKKYKSLILLTDESFVGAGDNQYRLYPYPTDGDLVINQAKYKEIVNRITPYFSYIRPSTYALIVLAVLIFPFVGAVFSLASKLVYLVIFTLPVWLVSKILKSKLSYGQTYRLSMHGLTLPILLAFVLGFFNVTLNFWLYSLIFLAFMTLVVVKLQKA